MKNHGNGQQDFDFSGGESGPRTRQEQIFKRFKKFHAGNREVWELFEYYTLQLINRGFEHHSSDAVVQRIRWHVDLETKDEEPYGKIKISDHYRAYYARLFHVAYPEHGGFFNNKKLRSEDSPPYKHEPSPEGEPPGPEEGLDDQLRALL
jgi:hypothetical protein